MHEHINTTLHKLQAQAFQEIECATIANHKPYFHILLSSNVAYISEAADVVSVKMKSKHTYTLPLLASFQSFSEFMHAEHQKVQHARKLFESISAKSKMAEEQLHSFSMLAVPPAFSKLSIIEIQLVVGIYAIFRFETMHALSFWNTKASEKLFVELAFGP